MTDCLFGLTPAEAMVGGLWAFWSLAIAVAMLRYVWADTARGSR